MRRLTTQLNMFFKTSVYNDVDISSPNKFKVRTPLCRHLISQSANPITSSHCHPLTQVLCLLVSTILIICSQLSGG